MRGTTNREAFKLYLEGERLFSVVAESDMAESRERFRDATKLDPGFARAWGWRSYTQVRSVLRGWLPEAEMAQGGKWAEKAVGLDPLDFATHWDLGFYSLNTRHFDKALESYRHGIKLYDEDTDQLDRKPGILAEAAEGFIHAGDPETAIALLERAMRIPDWYRWNLGFAYYQAGRFDEAVAVLQSMRARPGDRAYVPEAELFLIAAHYRKSAALTAEGNSLAAGNSMAHATEGIHRFKADNPGFRLEEAVAHRSRFKNKADEDYWSEPLQTLWNKK
jgi:tetratricopeptide (TPR) repeat protein